MIWLIRALALRLRGRWLRRHMRRPLPPPPPPPRVIIVISAPAHPDPHTATLRRHFAIGAAAPSRGRALKYHEYARIAQAVRAEHQEETT